MGGQVLGPRPRAVPPFRLVHCTGIALIVAALGLLAGCGHDGDAGAVDTSVRADTVLAVADVAPAIAAVEAVRGGPQRYTEINANADGVTLFVAVDEATEVTYFYSDGALEPPSAPVPISSASPPFSLDLVTRDLAPELVRQTQERFPGAAVTALALVQPPDTGLVWALKSRSPQGGILNVFYSPSGELVSVAPEDAG